MPTGPSFCEGGISAAAAAVAIMPGGQSVSAWRLLPPSLSSATSASADEMESKKKEEIEGLSIGHINQSDGMALLNREASFL